MAHESIIVWGLLHWYASWRARLVFTSLVNWYPRQSCCQSKSVCKTLSGGAPCCNYSFPVCAETHTIDYYYTHHITSRHTERALFVFIMYWMDIAAEWSTAHAGQFSFERKRCLASSYTQKKTSFGDTQSRPMHRVAE